MPTQGKLTRTNTGDKGVNVHDATLAGIEHFSKDKLAAIEVPESGVNTHDATLAGVTKFEKAKLTRTDTEEKQVLPTAEDIAAEKAETK